MLSFHSTLKFLKGLNGIKTQSKKAKSKETKQPLKQQEEKKKDSFQENKKTSEEKTKKTEIPQQIAEFFTPDGQAIKFYPSGTLIATLSPRAIYHRGEYLNAYIDALVNTGVSNIIIFVAGKWQDLNFEIEGRNEKKAAKEAEGCGRQSISAGIRQLGVEHHKKAAMVRYADEEKSNNKTPAYKDVYSSSDPKAVLAVITKEKAPKIICNKWSLDNSERQQAYQNAKKKGKCFVEFAPLELLCDSSDSDYKLLATEIFKKLDDSKELTERFEAIVEKVTQGKLKDPKTKLNCTQTKSKVREYLRRELPSFAMYKKMAKDLGQSPAYFAYPTSFNEVNEQVFKLFADIVDYREKVTQVDVRFRNARKEEEKQMQTSSQQVKKVFSERYEDITEKLGSPTAELTGQQTPFSLPDNSVDKKLPLDKQELPPTIIDDKIESENGSPINVKLTF